MHRWVERDRGRRARRAPSRVAKHGEQREFARRAEQVSGGERAVFANANDRVWGGCGRRVCLLTTRVAA